MQTERGYHSKTCLKCMTGPLERLPRTWLWDRILSLAGLFPWECRNCGARSYLQARITE